jgi:hypothetical protein
MVRNMMLATVFGALLSTTVVYAQEEAVSQEAIRFEPAIQVRNLENGGMAVLKPGVTESVAALSYKAYPYGSTFTLDAGASCRLLFSDLSSVVLTGPAKITPIASDVYKKIVLNVQRGDLKIAVDERAQAGQFTVKTPMGTFTSLKGTSTLYVGDISDGEVGEDDFAYSVKSGVAIFEGLHYGMNEMTQANAFRASESAQTTATGKEFRDTVLVGASGEVKTTLPMGGENTGTVSIAPGTTLRVTRARHPSSQNWVVSVLTLFPNGRAQNYFCYVEGRGDEYATGDLLDEMMPQEEEEEELDEEDGESSEGGDEADDLGDDEML